MVGCDWLMGWDTKCVTHRLTHRLSYKWQKMLELLSQLKSGVVKVSNMEKSIIFLPTIFIFKSSYSNYKTNLFRGLHHSSVVTAGSRDIDNDKLHN